MQRQGDIYDPVGSIIAALVTLAALIALFAWLAAMTPGGM